LSGLLRNFSVLIKNEFMEFIKTMQQIADEIDAQFNEYDERKSVLVIVLAGSRYQTVMCRLNHHDKYQRDLIQFTTKVCDTDQFISYVDIMSSNADFVHSKFVISDGFLKVESTTYVDNANPSMLKEMILEVAQLADEWEFKITGQDIN